MVKYIYILILGLLKVIVITPETVYSQKLIADTAFIQVPVDTSLGKLNGRLVVFEDARSQTHEVLRITEKTVYNYIPVDHYIMIDTTMKAYVSGFFDSTASTFYRITLHHFDIDSRNGLVFPAITLQGEMDLYKISGRDTLKGKLLYDEWISSRGKKKGAPPKESLLLEKWENEFITNLKTIQAYNFEATDRLPYNFVSASRKPKTNLEINSRFIGGLDYYIVEGELMFFEPEANRRTLRTSHLFRYRNAKNFESVGFGRNAEHVFFRRNDRLVIDLNMNFMLGINRWKDINEVDHPIWHVVLLDLSFSQYVKYQPFHSKPSFVLGAGLFENVFYIPDEAFYFKPGFGIQVGYRF